MCGERVWCVVRATEKDEKVAGEQRTISATGKSTHLGPPEPSFTNG